MRHTEAAARERTHTLTFPDQRMTTRPCNSWCRGGVHCWLIFSTSLVYSDEERAHVGAFVECSGPYVEVIAVEPAPEALPWPDISPAAQLGWAVLYRLLPTDSPDDDTEEARP